MVKLKKEKGEKTKKKEGKTKNTWVRPVACFPTPSSAPCLTCRAAWDNHILRIEKLSHLCLCYFPFEGVVALSKSGNAISKKRHEANQAARAALATGKLSNEIVERRRQLSMRTLYIRFRGAKSRPLEAAELQDLTPNITRVFHKSFLSVSVFICIFHFCFLKFPLFSRNISFFLNVHFIVLYVG
jgi:hypothetical protein